jgi:hypothetical protein
LSELPVTILGMDGEVVLAIVSSAIALVALVVAIITAIFARSQTRSAKASADAAKVQAERAGEQVDVARQSADSAREQVEAARRQNELQEMVRQDQAQPYVVADVVPSPGSGHLLQVAVTNHGSTIAHNVRVKFDPPLMSRWQGRPVKPFAALDEGISFLAPGRSMKYHLGTSPDYFVGGQLPEDNKVTVDCEGPFGALPPLTYTLSLAALRNSEAAAPGTLGRIEDSINKLTKVMSQQ